MIYLDNAATTYQKPPEVKKELLNALKYCGGNPGRSSHRLSLSAAEKIYSVREKGCGLLSLDSPENIVFTYNATQALNLAIKAFVTDNCHVLCSDFEHNSVIRPLEKLRISKNIDYSTFSNEVDLSDELDKKKKSHTKGIICSIASNVTGDCLDLNALSDYATRNRLFLIIDASQAIGHREIDLSKANVDALCAPGHKALFGIAGCGFAYFRDKNRGDTLFEGGSGAESVNPYMPALLPEGYEAGTPGTPAIATLGAGIDFINKIGINNIEERLNFLTAECVERLSNIRELRLYKAGNGIVSFNLCDLPSSKVASMLDSYGICVRGGLHCAPSIHKKLGTLDVGAVRISFSYFNNIGEIDRLYKVLKSIRKGDAF